MGKFASTSQDVVPDATHQSEYSLDVTVLHVDEEPTKEEVIQALRRKIFELEKDKS